MQKFDMMSAWKSTLNMFKEHWAKIAAVQFFAFLISVGSFFLLFGTSSTMLFDPTQADPNLMAAEMAGKTGLFFVVGLLAMAFSIAGYFISWRIVLGGEQESLGGAILYGLVVTFPVIFAVTVLYLGLILTMTLIFLIFGTAAAGTMSLESSTIGAGAMVGIAIFYIGFLVLLLFLFARLGTTGAIMAANRSYNPFSAMVASWKMTKNNSLLLMLYLFLTMVLFLVVYIVLAMVGGLFAALSLVLGIMIGGIFLVALLIVYALVPLGIYDVLSDKQLEVGDIFD